MRFLSNFGCKIIFMCSVNFWHQQDSNSLFKGSIGHVTSYCKKKNRENYPGKCFGTKEKETGLGFNRGLALIGFPTTGPWGRKVNN